MSMSMSVIACLRRLACNSMEKELGLKPKPNWTECKLYILYIVAGAGAGRLSPFPFPRCRRPQNQNAAHAKTKKKKRGEKGEARNENESEMKWNVGKSCGKWRWQIISYHVFRFGLFFWFACQDRFHLICWGSAACLYLSQTQRHLLKSVFFIRLQNSSSGIHSHSLKHSYTHSITLSKPDFKVFNLPLDFLCFAERK